MMMTNFEECDCSCHNSHYRSAHMGPCCSWCPYCEKLIKIACVDAHTELCIKKVAEQLVSCNLGSHALEGMHFEDEFRQQMIDETIETLRRDYASTQNINLPIHCKDCDKVLDTSFASICGACASHFCVTCFPCHKLACDGL